MTTEHVPPISEMQSEYQLSTVDMVSMAYNSRHPEHVLAMLGKKADRILFQPPVGAPLYVLQHPEDIRSIWIGQQDKLDKTGLLYDTARRFVGRGLFPIENGPIWQDHQRTITPYLHPRHLTRLDEHCVAATDHMLRSLRTERQEHILERMHERIKALSLQITASTLLGEEVSDAEATRITDAFTTINNFVSRSTILGGLPDVFYRRMPLFLRTVHTAEQTIKQYADDIAASNNRSTFLDMVRHQGEKEVGAWSNNEIRDEIITILAAGHGTTASAICWSLYALSQPQNAHHQEEIRRQLNDGVHSDAPDARISWVLSESLRLYPPVFATGRQTVEDISITNQIGPLYIPAGSQVLISPYLTHRHPKFWKDPEQFHPERFADELSDRHAFIAFGFGKRRCPGERMATRVATTVLAHIWKKFQTHTDASCNPVFMATMRPSDNVSISFRNI